MGAIWTDENRFQKWLDVEIAVCEVHADMARSARRRRQDQTYASFSVDRINKIEHTTRHDVIAFTTALAESIGPESRFVHYGLTSSDVVDTANALLMRDAATLYWKTGSIGVGAQRRAIEHKHTAMIGRTHGVHAEPTSLGRAGALLQRERTQQERLATRAK